MDLKRLAMRNAGRNSYPELSILGGQCDLTLGNDDEFLVLTRATPCVHFDGTNAALWVWSPNSRCVSACISWR
jgi:hypothetical protein